MKTIGMIGGLGPESTVDYYKLLIASYRERITDDSYPHLLINSINLQNVVRRLDAGDHAGLVEYLTTELRRLEAAGAVIGFIGANTPHIVFDELRRRSTIPLVSIVEATCQAVQAIHLTRVGLIGSRYTMQGRFFPDVFSKNGIELITPHAAEQDWIHDHYMGELVKGVFLPETRDEFMAIADRMKQRHAIQALILGGTELPLLLRGVSSDIPFLDTAKIHVQKVLAEAM
jgi:aspartate racemase